MSVRNFVKQSNSLLFQVSPLKLPFCFLSTPYNLGHSWIKKQDIAFHSRAHLKTGNLDWSSFTWHFFLAYTIWYINSQLSRCSTARGSSSGLSLGGPSKVKARKSFLFPEGFLGVENKEHLFDFNVTLHFISLCSNAPLLSLLGIMVLHDRKDVYTEEI